MNIVALFQGYTYFYVHPETPSWNHFFSVFSGPLFVLFSTLLTRKFLNLRRFSKILDNVMLGNMMLNLFMALLMIIFSHKISYKYHHYFILVHPEIAFQIEDRSDRLSLPLTIRRRALNAIVVDLGQ